MNKPVFAAALAGLLALTSAGVQALPFLPDIAVGATGGTAGVGVQLTSQVIPFVNARLQVQGLSFAQRISEDGIDYDGNLELLSGGVFIDFYPLLKGPKISLGLVGNGNNINAKSSCPQTCKVGELEITGNRAAIRGDFGVNNFSPYLGFGFGNPMAGTPFYVGFDAGVLFHGRPRPSLSITGIGTVTDPSTGTRFDINLGTDPEVQASIIEEQANLADDIKDWKFYPVVQLNLGWRF